MWKREIQYILHTNIYENPNYETKTERNTQLVLNLRFQPKYLSNKFSPLKTGTN
jgi:hypothetical protein